MTQKGIKHVHHELSWIRMATVMVEIASHIYCCCFFSSYFRLTFMPKKGYLEKSISEQKVATVNGPILAFTGLHFQVDL